MEPSSLSVVDLECLEHWLDGHLCETEEREVAKWHEPIVQTYVDRTGDSPPNSTVGESSCLQDRQRCSASLPMQRSCASAPELDLAG